MKLNPPKYKLFFLGIDVLILTVSFFLALNIIMPNFWTASGEGFYFYFTHFSLCIAFLAIFIFTFRYNMLYRRDVVIFRHRHFILLIKSVLAASAVCVLFMVFGNMDYLILYGKDLLVNFVLCSLVLFLFCRALPAKKIFHFLVEKKINLRRVLVIGGDEAGRYVAESLGRSSSLADFQVTGFLDDYKAPGARMNGHFSNLGNLDDLDAVVRDKNVDEIIVAIDHAPYNRLIYIVEKCLQTGKHVRIYSDLLRVVAKKMDIEHYGNIPVIELSQYPLDGPAWSDKRIVDIIASVAALVVLSPLFLAIAIGIKLSSKGPIIFKQQRIGKDGKPFNFYKFRSMHLGMDNSRHENFVKDFINGDNACDNLDIPIFKITDDPRIFRFGRFIRKTSMDEFPQLINVLKGDMSLVGPRPCLDYEWECYEDWHKMRLRTLPGCTGVWQALGRSSVTFEEMVILDLYYISNMTLWLDLKIVLKTFPVIFLGKGGH